MGEFLMVKSSMSTFVAAIGLDEVRTEEMPFTEDTMGYGDVFVAHRDDGFAVIMRGARFQGHQCVLIGLTVERAGAGDRDVGFPEGINERRIVHAFGAFEAGENQRR